MVVAESIPRTTRIWQLSRPTSTITFKAGMQSRVQIDP